LAPRYRVPHERGYTTWAEDYNDVYGRVVAGNIGTFLGDEYTEVEGFVARYGRQRSFAVRTDLTGDDLEAFKRTWLAEHGQPVVRASVARTREHPLLDTLPAFAATTGEWFQVGDKPPQICVAAHH